MERILKGLDWSRSPCKGLFKDSFGQGAYVKETISKKHWFYSIRPKKYQKTIGFTVSVRKSIKKALILQYPSEKVVKNNWFYTIRPKKYQKTIGFTDRATKNVEKPLVLQTGQPKTLKNHWFYSKTSPGQRGNRPCNRSGVWSANTLSGYIMRNPYSQAV